MKGGRGSWEEERESCVSGGQCGFVNRWKVRRVEERKVVLARELGGCGESMEGKGTGWKRGKVVSVGGTVWV